MSRRRSPAGLAGCSLVSRLRQRGFRGSIAVLEAGRGPGGRTATRRSRHDTQWRLDHGAPGFNLTAPVPKAVEEVLDPLRRSGTVRREWGQILGLDEDGSIVQPRDPDLLAGEWLRGFPTMASVCEALLGDTNDDVRTFFGRRIRWLKRVGSHWILSESSRHWTLKARRLVLSGSLLAHQRSLTMLAWPDIPLREAVPEGQDPKLDQALRRISTITASIRWNLMLECDGQHPLDLPRQLLLTPRAQARWGVERIVFHPQDDLRLGLVVHGLDNGEPIHPESQPRLLKQQEQRQQECLGEILKAVSDRIPLTVTTHSLGVMRWGAARPLSNPLPHELQWCPTSEIGFCGDWVEGEGFGRAQGALTSGADLADRLTASCSLG